ncbi:hypothetical protein IH601_01655 [Candidatus Bipolaricaulota bacterium]|nr:hypothetical protein [Candidatus Bipolaricaulota bacterium]
MSRREAIDPIEIRAMRATLRDGIGEMLLGGMLLVFGVLFYLATPLAALGCLFPLVLNPLGKYLKRRFVYPRIGYARTARKPHALRGIALASGLFIAFILAALGLFVLILGLGYGYVLWLSHFVPAIAGFLMAIGPWVVARTYRLARWYVFAAVFIAAGVCLPMFHIATGYSAVALESAIVGGLSLLYGIGLFVTFLIKTPDEVQVTTDGAQ